MEIGLIFKLLVHIPCLLVYYYTKCVVQWFIPKELRYKDISNEIALITGAGSGIGRGIALHFARRGIKKIVLMDINMEGLKETRELIKEHPQSKHVEISLYECDVSRKSEVYATASKIKKDVGIVTMLINNAGVCSGKLFLDCPDEMIEKTFRVNILAHFWTCKAFLPDMKAKNHGHIIATASAGGYLVCPKLIDYSASKSAVIKFQEALRMELECEGYDGIYTTAAAPYFTNTGFYAGYNYKFFPEMNVDWVTEKIVSGILLNEEIIIVPPWLNFFISLLMFAPYCVLRYVSKSTNIFNAMNDFRGNKQL